MWTGTFRYMSRKEWVWGGKWIGWIATTFPLHLLQFLSMVHQRISFWLRQGDPLSPLMFLLIMEVFNRMIEPASGAGLMSGFSVDRSSMTTLKVSHLFFLRTKLLYFVIMIMRRWSTFVLFLFCFKWFQACGLTWQRGLSCLLDKWTTFFFIRTSGQH